MTCVRRFTCDDLFTFNNVNLDYFTETVSPSMKVTRLTCLAPILTLICTKAPMAKASLCRNVLPCLSMLAVASRVAVPSASQCDQFGQSPTAMKGVFCPQYNLPFYLQYLANWPEYCLMAEGADSQAMGYILGKVEGADTDWHGHVTAVTVAPENR